MELCGGTHVKRTSQLGSFKIINEIGISAGIRRIEALSGQAVFEYLSDRNVVVNQLSDLLKSNPNQLLDRVSSLQKELLIKNKELVKIKSELASFKYSSLSSKAEKIGSFSFLVTQIDGVDGNSLQSTALDLTSKIGDNSAVVLGVVSDDSKKLFFVASFGSNLLSIGFHAGKFINNVAKICGGGGGGKPNFAQAGAKNVDKFLEALDFAKAELIENFKDNQNK